MGLQLKNILARIGVRARKEDGQSLVDGLALVVLEWQVMRLPRLKWLAAKSVSPRFQVWP
jgi:hypothetical protein